ncbi:helix-turn-helix domain-containing protein [Kiloniella sp.]|uniref:helix-turn-helix domain-containing protein n=1 Tax=Kiloniella sp. TaxID=1938587 RepID=UPI003A9228D8
MVKQMNDLPEINTEETLAHKLRAARDYTNLSRAKVQAETGISAKSLEKYEDGTSEPPLSRLKTLCELYGLSLHELLGKEKTAENQVLRNIPGSIEEITEESPKEVTEGMNSFVRDALQELDRYRISSFEGHTRKATALSAHLTQIIKYLEVNELLQLAIDRGLFIDDCPDEEALFGMMETNFESGQSSCSDIEERVVDTAILGIDLHSVERDALVRLADDLSEDFDIDSEVIFGWGKHKDFVPKIRAPLRQLALTGNQVDLINKELFPLH